MFTLQKQKKTWDQSWSKAWTKLIEGPQINKKYEPVLLILNSLFYLKTYSLILLSNLKRSEMRKYLALPGQN